MSRRPTVHLFDVDGTLVNTGGAGRRSIERAFHELHGREDACALIRFGGMTDRAIVRQGLQAISVADDDAAIDALLARYLEHLAVQMRSAETRVLPGAREAVDALVGRERVAVGLGTGNVRRGAELKLAPAGLAELFPFGGFGCDHEDRAELLRVGARRGAARLGVPLEDCRVVVIGDTPRDVEAARAIGAECVAVATSHFGVDELAACGARHAFPDLTAPGALDVLVGR